MSDEINNLRVIAANWQALAGPASAWRSRFNPVVDETNETLFDPATLALVRAIDTMPQIVTIEGVVAEVIVGRCDCRQCSDGVVESEHCLDWHGNRIHACSALEAMDRAFAKGSRPR